jgi:photosystem II stability/assembly factor-like uncharacterized protein
MSTLTKLRLKPCLWLLASLVIISILAFESRSLLASDGISYLDHFYGVSAVGTDDVWVCGNAVNIFHSSHHGATWSKQKTPVQAAWYDICFADRNTGWAVGELGSLIKTSDGGKNWVQQKIEAGYGSASPSKITYKLFKLCALDTKTVWITGEWGTVLYSGDGGATWELKKQKEDYLLNDISFTNRSCGAAVGEFSNVIYTNDAGNTWSKIGLPFKDRSLFGVCFSGNSEIWCCGIDGTIMKIKPDPLEVASANSPIRKLLHAIKIIDNFGLAIGNEGTCLLSTDGGTSWSRQNVGASFWLCDAEVIKKNDKYYCWLVGGHGYVSLFEVTKEGLVKVTKKQ